MEFNGRTTSILRAAIEDFISTGEPVSSGQIYKEYDFGIKPAMIRIELEKLSDEGYLTQPHHSAGRVPTDKGYEFFAREMLTERNAPGNLERVLANFLVEQSWEEMLRMMSSELGLLGVLTDSQGTYKEGIDDLISNLEWESRGEVESVINDFVEIDRRLESIRKKMEQAKAPEVFIGRKSPVTKSENLSVVMRKVDADGAEVLVVGVGPKRMDYKKVIRVFKNI